MFYEVKLIAVCKKTHLNHTRTDTLRRHHVFGSNRSPAQSFGGVAVVVRRGVACAKVFLRTLLEAEATRVLIYRRLITVVSSYLPLYVPLHNYEIESIIDQLP